jgi:hypothetical protein
VETVILVLGLILGTPNSHDVPTEQAIVYQMDGQSQTASDEHFPYY